MSKTAGPSSFLCNVSARLRVFQAFIGWWLYVVFALRLLAALVEGVGIVMLMPLLQRLNERGPAMEGPPQVGLGGGTPDSLTQFMNHVGLTSVEAILAAIGVAFLIKGLVVFAAGAYGGYLEVRLMRKLRVSLYDNYSRMDYLYYAQRDTGYFINLITAQLNSFYWALRSFTRFFSGMIASVIYLVLALTVAWRFGLMALMISFVLVPLFKRLNNHVSHLSREGAREDGHLTKLLIQTLQGFKYLAATGQTDQLRKGVIASVQRLGGYEIRQELTSSLTSSIREPLSVLCIIAIVIIQITILHQPLGPIIVSILLFHRGLLALLGIQEAWQTSLREIGAVELVRDEFAAQAANREPDGRKELGPLARDIGLRDVCYAYDAKVGDVLNHVSFLIPAKSTVALVGDSGAGKTTLVDVISLLLKPRSGEVLIDGVPGAEVKLASWRSQIGYVPQETVVFDDTLANNICLWSGDSVTDSNVLKRVRDAARAAHIADFIERLPEGYQTRAGDRGVRLSGGQRQRLGIARELFKKPSLLILDEATSALDSESEGYIRQSIDVLRGQLTVVIIAHRLSTIRNVDHVFVFDKGHLVEHGPYAVLRDRQNSRFRGMADLQNL
jgi:ABC-type multidrug transport system fused ATPase/permease subunit